jgi:hypothetical protein
METKPITLTGAPPRMMNSIIAGFNTVANHIQLILPPILLDLFLWFGPHLSINELSKQAMQWLMQYSTPDAAQMVLGSQKEIQSFFEHINVYGLLRTFPIGVSSLLAWQGEIVNPLGKAPLFDLPGWGSTMIVSLGIILSGLAIGSIYFSSVAFFSADHPMPVTFVRRIAWGYLQTVSLAFILLVVLLAITIPATLILSVIAMINPTIAQFIVLIAVFFLLWMLLPLVFSPHGIFAYGMNAIASLLTSAKLVRSFLPGTGLFLLIMILLSEGLNVVWRAAPADSWMTLIGIGGHAFITTGLLAGSFIYYQGGMRWMQENLEKMVSNIKKA